MVLSKQGELKNIVVSLHINIDSKISAQPICFGGDLSHDFVGFFSSLASIHDCFFKCGRVV